MASRISVRKVFLYVALEPLPFVESNLLLYPALQRFRKAVDSLPDDQPLERDRVHISNIGAAIGASYLADGFLFERLGFPFESIIYGSQSFFLCLQGPWVGFCPLFFVSRPMPQSSRQFSSLICHLASTRPEKQTEEFQRSR